MIPDATGTARDQALEEYQAQADLIEADLGAGQISRDQAAEAMRAARARYERAALKTSRQ